MPTTLLTPVSKGKARPVGASLWRRQLLPLGTINYNGREIRFDRDYLASLVKAFAAKAFDAVPFQFADVDNKHTNRPEDRRGTVRALELTDDGLDVLVEAGPAAAKILQEYPDLGVSASIKEGYDRSDGRFFPAAIRHVLATLDPRIPGMRQWQSVEASNPAGGLWELCTDFTAGDGEVINLTSYDYAAPDAPPPAEPVLAAPEQPAQTPEPAGPAPTKEEPTMALNTEQEARLAKLLDLPEDQFTALLTARTPEPEAKDGAEEGDEDKPADAADMFTDAELQAMIDAEDGETAEPEGELEPAGADLSQEARDAINLANARAEQTDTELRRMRAQLDLATYEKERDTYVRQGVPADLVDLARPLLEGTGRTVELANGKSTDAGAIMRRMLTEFAGRMKALGLDVELGNPQGADDEGQAEEAARADRDRVKAQMAGLGHR